MDSYFEGWYFKQQTAEKTLAVIPSFHVDNKGKRMASLQIISDSMVQSIQYPADSFFADRKKLLIRVGENTFSSTGICLNVDRDNLQIKGQLTFGKLTSPAYDIMGPFAYLPFMECKHSVISLSHGVQGELMVNGSPFCLSFGTGYIEGDRGKSFPKRYIWTQCNFGHENSLMLSVADIPFLGRTFIGVIGSVWLDKKEIRLATYLGAHRLKTEGKSVTIKQGKWKLTATLIEKKDYPLKAPIKGQMSRVIHESVACIAHYRLQKEGEIILDFESNNASFEYEW